MNIVFWLLVVICVFTLWCLCAFAFKPIGKLFHKIGEDVVKGLEISEDDINKQSKNKEEQKDA